MAGPGRGEEWKHIHVDYLRWRLGSITALLRVAPLLIRLWRLLGIVTTTRGSCVRGRPSQTLYNHKMRKKYLEVDSTGRDYLCSGCSSRCWTWWKARGDEITRAARTQPAGISEGIYKDDQTDHGQEFSLP